MYFGSSLTPIVKLNPEVTEIVPGCFTYSSTSFLVLTSTVIGQAGVGRQIEAIPQAFVVVFRIILKGDTEFCILTLAHATGVTKSSASTTVIDIGTVEANVKTPPLSSVNPVIDPYPARPVTTQPAVFATFLTVWNVFGLALLSTPCNG